MPSATSKRRSYSVLTIEDFSGGWNARDAWSEIADNELPDVLNMTLDQRGGLVKRLGLTKVNGSDQIVNSGNVQSLYYSAVLDSVFAQVGTELYKSTDGGINWGASIKTFSTSARCHMVDFLGALVFIHPVDNAFSYNGTTVTGPIANSPDGTCIAVWQNALWSVGDPAAPTRLYRSDLGAITWPASPVFVDIRALDDRPLTAVGGGEGIDVVGRAGLLVFKDRSCYRVHDTATGSYTVQDSNYGAAGPMCITTNNGVTGAISTKGVISLRGDGSEAALASSKIEPLFHPSQLTYANAATMCAGNYEDRMIFSLPFDAATVNSLTLEYSPDYQWIVPHDFGLSAMTSYTKNTNRLFGGKVGTGSSSYGYVLDVFTGGSDDGAAISARAQTRWFEPGLGGDVRYRRAVVNGRGIFSLYVKRNYDTGQGDLNQISILGGGGVWGTAVWGVDTYGTNLQQDYQEIFSLGHGRSISFEVQEVSSLTDAGLNMLDVGAAETSGGFALYGIALDMVLLGRS